MNEKVILNENEIYEKMFKQMLSVDFHKEDQAEVSVVASKNFLLYSASVIIERSIPDLRDGLKPSQRRILYLMKKMGLSYSGTYKKSARISGLVIGSLHPHGDIAVYEAMVNMSQPWKYNLPLIDGQGNWGSIDGDDPASQRYTEARLTKHSISLFRDIEHNTVNFLPNYDGLETEPEILPATLPLILMNGVLKGSIAVGMDSSILPHNAKEITELIKNMISYRKENKEFGIKDFTKIVKGPDLPTGGIVYDLNNWEKIVETGKGSVKIRSKYHIEKEGRKNLIVITEIPFGKLKPKLIQGILDLKQDKENKFSSAISNISDQSTEDIRIVIEVKNGWDPEGVINYIFNNTEFDTKLSYGTVVIDIDDQGRKEPKEYGLLDLANRFLDHRFIIVNRKFKSIKEKSEEKLHIIEGLIICLDRINEVIEVIKKSRNSETALKNLMKNFELTKEQATAILNMKLSKLTSVNKNELLNTKRELKNAIKHAKEMLASYSLQCDYLLEDIEEIEKDFSIERRTLIDNSIKEDIVLDIPKEKCSIEYTKEGYIKKVEKSKHIELVENDFIQQVIETYTTEYLSILTNQGQIFNIPIYKISNSNKGIHINNLVELRSEEKIISLFVANKEDILISFTEKGLVKKSKFENFYANTRKSGVRYSGVNEEDNIIGTHIIDKEQDLIFIASNSKTIKFSSNEVSFMGNSAKGVRAIKLKEGEIVLNAFIEDQEFCYLFTENAFVRILKFAKLNEQSRGGVGTLSLNTTKTTGVLKLSKVLKTDTVIVEYEEKLEEIDREELGKSENKRPEQCKCEKFVNFHEKF